MGEYISRYFWTDTRYGYQQLEQGLFRRGGKPVEMDIVLPYLGMQVECYDTAFVGKGKIGYIGYGNFKSYTGYIDDYGVLLFFQ